jgi:hypothetical protein
MTKYSGAEAVSGLFLIVIALVALVIYFAVVYWYVAISIIALVVIYYKREKIVKLYKEKLNIKNFRTGYNPQASIKYPFNIRKLFYLTDSEIQSIFGSDWQELLTEIHQLYQRSTEIGNNIEKIVKLQKNQILKFSEIFEIIHKQYVSEIQENGPISEELNESAEQNYKRILDNCKEAYENYTYYKTIFSESNFKQNKDQYSWNGYDSSKKGSSKNSKYSYIKAQRVRERLAKFRITSEDAQIIFGKSWESKFGKPEWEFLYVVMNISINVRYDDGRYRKKYGKLYFKVLEIIEIVTNENPEADFNEYKKYNKYYKKHEDFNKNYSYDKYSNSDETWDETIDENLEAAFAILGLNRDATVEEIKTRYHELILKNHPDKNKSPESTIKTTEINTAHDMIMEAKNTA